MSSAQQLVETDAGAAKKRISNHMQTKGGKLVAVQGVRLHRQRHAQGLCVLGGLRKRLADMRQVGEVIRIGPIADGAKPEATVLGPSVRGRPQHKWPGRLDSQRAQRVVVGSTAELVHPGVSGDEHMALAESEVSGSLPSP